MNYHRVHYGGRPDYEFNCMLVIVSRATFVLVLLLVVQATLFIYFILIYFHVGLYSKLPKSVIRSSFSA
jgi:hypothetical protein